MRFQPYASLSFGDRFLFLTLITVSRLSGFQNLAVVTIQVFLTNKYLSKSRISSLFAIFTEIWNESQESRKESIYLGEEIII